MMDRRQRKTREAIFKAFTHLLAKKEYTHITVGEIIELADVGRATFYAHFETKDFLLKELCGELFCHIFDEMEGSHGDHRHIFDCDAPDSVFLHLLRHLQTNDNQILELLSCQNNDLFLSYFKQGLARLVTSQLSLFAHRKDSRLPEGFWIDHIVSTFVSTVRWWLERGRKETPEEITDYFLLAV